MGQCLEEVQFVLNDQTLDCTPLTEYTLPENFVLKANHEELHSQKLVEARQRLAIGWIKQYEFSNIDMLPNEEEPSLTILHPSIERFLLTAIIITLCCWKVPCFREGTFSIIRRIQSALYEMCTTERFRLKQENAQLKKKLEREYKELEEIEDLMEKKKKMNRKLPDVPDEQISAAPAPPPEVNERYPGQPKIHMSRTKAEFHKEDRYSV